MKGLTLDSYFATMGTTGTQMAALLKGLSAQPLDVYSEEGKNYNTTHAVEVFADGTYKLYKGLNFTLGWRYQPKKVYYEIGMFGKNIFDEKYIVDAGNSGRNIGFPTFIGGTRSVIGVQAKIGF